MGSHMWSSRRAAPERQANGVGPRRVKRAASGLATATPGPDGLVISVDDSTFNERCPGRFTT